MSKGMSKGMRAGAQSAQACIPACSPPHSPAPLPGMGLTTARLAALLKLATKARRFFPPEAAYELWSLLRPAASNAAIDVAEAFEAVGWLYSLLPTHQLCRCAQLS